jgi:hypothetical protein
MNAPAVATGLKPAREWLTRLFDDVQSARARSSALSGSV